MASAACPMDKFKRPSRLTLCFNGFCWLGNLQETMVFTCFYHNYLGDSCTFIFTSANSGNGWMAIHIIGVVKINALAKKVLSLIAEYSMIPKVGRAILTAYEASTHQRAAFWLQLSKHLRRLAIWKCQCDTLNSRLEHSGSGNGT